MVRLPILFALLFFALAGQAQIYKTVDADGNVSYSDTPASGGASEEVEMRHINTTPPPPAIVPRERPAAEEEPAAVNYRPVITAPANETTIPMGPGNFQVNASVEPALAPGTALQLYIDGQPQGVPQDSPGWALTNVFRGAHDLEVAVVDTSGRELARSGAVRVYVLRPSVNFKNR
ncbi:MAG: DUF4124 domain-containing protein [Halieaceae bacterium]|nr:DUF4124 domain-containing protein [Halieaceae bacterium]MCP5163719.1 DUF4124 domain-containing protein [Pseudomonadales bacterium]